MPKNVKRAVAAGSLAILLTATLVYASVDGPLAPVAEEDEVAQGPDLDDRSVWAHVSRGGSDRTELGLLESNPVTFTVLFEGEELEVSSGATTLADALIDHGIVVGFDDRVSAEMNQPPQDGAEIEIVRVGTVFGAESEEIPFDTEERRTSSLLRGVRQVQTQGVPGQRVRTFTATYEDGQEVSREITAEILAQSPVTEVVLVGTAAPQPVRAQAPRTSTSSTSSAPPRTYSGADPRSIARQMVADRGWGAEQFNCLDRLWQKESNWNPYAQNRSSGAYGIPQSLPGNKMAAAGADWRTNPVTQMTWGLNYIAGRYGTPCAAWAHSQARNWY